LKLSQQEVVLEMSILAESVGEQHLKASGDLTRSFTLTISKLMCKQISLIMTFCWQNSVTLQKENPQKKDAEDAENSDFTLL